MKARPSATVSFDCDTEEEEERHQKGVAKRKERSLERFLGAIHGAILVARKARRRRQRRLKNNLQSLEPAVAVNDGTERIHNLCTFHLFWKGNVKELKALYKKSC